MGMVGGGQGAFIGWVHRMAAALDQQVDFVAGCFSKDIWKPLPLFIAAQLKPSGVTSTAIR
jgi:hypothetical protein